MAVCVSVVAWPPLSCAFEFEIGATVRPAKLERFLQFSEIIWNNFNVSSNSNNIEGRIIAINLKTKQTPIRVSLRNFKFIDPIIGPAETLKRGRFDLAPKQLGWLAGWLARGRQSYVAAFAVPVKASSS